MEILVSNLENKGMEHGKLFIEFKFEADRINEIIVQLNNIKTPSELCAAVNRWNEKANQSPPHSWLQKNVELLSSEICAAVNKKNEKDDQSPPSSWAQKNVELPSSEICVAVNTKNEKDDQPSPCSAAQNNVELPSSEICAAVNTNYEKEEQPPSSSRVNETCVVPYSSGYSNTSFHGIQHHPNALSFIYGYPYASLMPQPVVFGNVYLRNESENPQYEIDLYKIISGKDTRTLLIIKNIPYMWTSKTLLSVMEKDHKGIYDFLYLPFNVNNKCNFSYAFINMLSAKLVIAFYQDFHANKWEYRYNSDKVPTLAYAKIQGKAELVKHFQNSGLINEDKRCWPILFRSQGLKNIDQEQFPSSNVNIIIRQPDGSYTGDFVESLNGDLDEN